MQLIKVTEERKREVWLLDDRYRKIWRYVKSDLLKRHVDLLNLVFPGYILSNGIDENSMWVDYKIIEGVPANTIKLTDENIERIYRFCINNLESTAPFYHGDWQLSNMIIKGDDITLIDWDNINTDTRDDMMIKMHFDLKESIGQRFDKFIDQRYLSRKIYKTKILNNKR